MSPLLVNIGIVLLFVLIGGFFAAAEMALVSLRESQVSQLAQRGSRGRAVRRLHNQPNRFLSAVQMRRKPRSNYNPGPGFLQVDP